MAPAIPIIAAIGAVVSTVGVVMQADASKKAADFNANQASENARISIAQADDQEKQFRIMSRKSLADARTGYAASGVSLEGGSAQDVLEEGAATAEHDALKIREGGQIRARGFQSDATLSTMRANAAQSGGYMSAAASLLGGARKFYGKGGYDDASY